VDALLDLLQRGPGPDPIVFGSSERRIALAHRLGDGQLRPVEDAELRAARDALQTAVAQRDDLHRSAVAEADAEAVLADDRLVEETRVAAPGLLDPAADLDLAATLLRTATDERSGWWGRRQAGRASGRLRNLARTPDADLGRLARALQVGRALRSTRPPSPGSLRSPTLVRLEQADADAKEAAGRWLSLEVRSSDRLDRRGLGAVSAVATALRSGRGARRDQLARLDGSHLTGALPLWVGTLADVDDLLPAKPALFDLVIVDEASAVDQPLAAATLLRGSRAIVAGDPRQLRHVSFTSEQRVGEILTANDLTPTVAARLDVRRNSCFDVAASAAPVVLLDEHFRSAPHLVDFVARRLYGGKVHIATRCPLNDHQDCVDVVRLDGARRHGVVQAEVEWVVAELVERRRRRAPSVGVVTPFRAQADALEAAVLARFTADDVEGMDLRIGTAHAFQGNERDEVLVSIGIGADDPPGTWGFVEDPHLSSPSS
jgi:hypothetical protein